MSAPLTPEEIMARLKEAGVDPKEWVEREPGSINPPFARKQAELLTQMRGLFEVGLEGKQGELAVLHESLARLKHGGGR